MNAWGIARGDRGGGGDTEPGSRDGDLLRRSFVSIGGHVCVREASECVKEHVKFSSGCAKIRIGRTGTRGASDDDVETLIAATCSMTEAGRCQRESWLYGAIVGRC